MFAQLNRGEEVTKGLRKVDKSEMTHKNPALRAGNTVPASTSGAAGKWALFYGTRYGESLIISNLCVLAKKPLKPTKPQALMGKKPSKFALEGNKWVIVCMIVCMS